MKKILEFTYTVPVFLTMGSALFAAARSDGLEPLAMKLARGLARSVHAIRGVRSGETPAELAREWQRLMPSPREEVFPIVSADDDTAFVEIRLDCPLRGRGDGGLACWRAMEFDRALVARSGGALVVMESQSVTGGSCCKLAIRREGASFDDLPVAHPRWRGASASEE